MKRTPNYALPTWEKSDFIKMDDFNGLTQKLDDALKAQSDAASDGLSEEASARQSADTALQSAITALGANLGTHGRNCRIATGSYVGAGGYGAANARSLSFDFVPMIVFIAADNIGGSIGRSVLLRPLTEADSQSDEDCMVVSWTTNGVSWYTSETRSEAQNNYPNCTYHYLALGYDT